MSEGQIMWGTTSDINPVSTNLAVLNSNYKTKFKMLGEELIELSNKLGKDCYIDINIRYEDSKC